ncbi:MAG: toxin TcdB middle/N-terminal domain-containing protein [Limisphaerales bacterium]
MKKTLIAFLTGLMGLAIQAQTVTEQTAPVTETAPVEEKATVKPDQGGGEQAMAMGGSEGGAGGGGGGGAGSPAAPGTLNFQADLFTGRFNYSIPIIVPPARQGAEPKLGLGYNSSGGNGWCGVGWGLEVGFIQRDTRRGVPVKWTNGVATPLAEYDDDKGFVASIGGVSANLVKVSTSGSPVEYRAEVDGAFLKFLFYDNYWRVVDKSGNTFLFGQTNTTRMENPKSGWTGGAAKSTFRWALDRVLDVNGNETLITYTNDGNLLYLSQIRYNGNTNSPALTTYNTVDFTLTSRADTNITFQSGYRIETRKLLSEITARASNNLARRYVLTYTNSTSTPRSLLASVRMYGADNTSSLPATTFSYQNKPWEFSSQLVNWTNVASEAGTSESGWQSIASDGGEYSYLRRTYVTLQDINGDGLPDRVMLAANSYETTFKVQLNTGFGFSPLQSWGPLQDPAGMNGPQWDSPAATYYLRTYATLRDMNGDGIADRVHSPIFSGSPYDKWVVQTNTGLGLATNAYLTNLYWTNVTSEIGSGSWDWSSIHSVDGSGPVYVELMDLNGDGLPDRVMNKYYSPYEALKVQLNTGAGFGELRSWPGVNSEAGQDPYWSTVSMTGDAPWIILQDINGDGLPDRVMRKLYSPYSVFKVQFNNGAGFDPVEDWGSLQDPSGMSSVGWDSPTASYYLRTYATLRDINGDGLPDRVHSPIFSGSPYDKWVVQFNTGAGFGPLTNWTNVTSESGTSSWDWSSITSVDGTGPTYLDLIDIDGDGLPDRVMRKLSYPYDVFKVQLNNGPFPDLLNKVENGIGGSVQVTYTPSTKFDNTDSQGRARLPFPVYTVATVGVCDGMGATNTTTYSYLGGMFDGEKREFRGFNQVAVTDPLGAVQKTCFHQGGGRDETAGGEYQDAGSKAKKGIPYLVETYGSDGLLYSRTLNKVEETQLHTNGWYFPYISQSIQMEYEGQSGYRATAKQLTYDTGTGNLVKESSFGEVSGVVFTNHAFTDVTTADNVYTHITFATLSNGDIKNKPSSIKITSDSAGSTRLRETQFAYDGARGNLLTKSEWLNTISGYVTGSIGYDTYGNPTTATNAGGIVTTTTYDTNKTFAQQQITATFTNSSFMDIRSGTVITATDVRGMTVSNVFDAFFRTTEVLVSTNANGAPVLWKSRTDYSLGGITNGISYNYVRSRANDLTDSNGLESYTYADGLGRTRQTRTEAEAGAGSNQFRVSNPYYNQRGQVFFSTLPYFSTNSNFTVLTSVSLGAYTGFDPIGRVSNTLAAVSAQFSASGQPTNLTITGGDSGSPVGQALVFYREGTDPWATIAVDAEGKTNITRLDAYGRPIYHLQTGAAMTNYVYKEYNLVGDLTRTATIAYENGTWGSWIITSLFNDSLGRKTLMIDPSMGWWSYAYDSLGRMTNQTDGKGQFIRLYYDDALGRLTHKHVYNASSALVATSTNYYDSSDDGNYTVFKGQLYKAVDSEGWEKFSYDARGRVVKSTRYLNTNSTSYTVETTYDDADRVREVKYPGSSPARVGYEYDSGGNLARVFHLKGSVTNEYFYVAGQFNALGQALTFATASSNLWTTNTYYTNSQRMLGTVTTSGGATRQSLSYTYDNVSNLKGIWDSGYAGTASATMTNLAYDDFHRLTALTSPQWGTKTYAYNAYGNMLTNSEAGGGQYAYTNSSRPYQVTSANGKSYAYDANGNMTTRGSQTLTYNAENRLASVSGGGGPTVTFGYAEGGARLWRDSSANGLTVWIGGIYEVRAAGTGNEKVLCHVSVGGKRIATFEPTELTASLPVKYPWLAASLKGLDRALIWPLRDGRAPVTVMVLTLLGILLASLLARGGIRVLGRARNGLVDILARPAFKHTPEWWQELLLSLAELLPSCAVSIPDARRQTLFPKLPFYQQALSVWLIVALILGTTPTDIQAQSYTPVFYYYLDDHLGSSSVLTDRSGTVVQRYTYSAYGRTQHQNNTSAYPLERMFTGQLLDDETGLYFYNARYYDPELGRFIQADSFVPDEDDGQALNRYSYVLNNPVRYTDPSGNSPSQFYLFYNSYLSERLYFNSVSSGGSAQAGGSSLGEVFRLWGGNSRASAVQDNRGAGQMGLGMVQPVVTPGYTDPFGNRHVSFCLSCHAPTPEAQFNKQQHVLANALDYRVIAYEQALSVVLTAGVSVIVEGLAAAVSGRQLLAAERATFRTWNQFQRGTAGQFTSRAETAKAWSAYKMANDIVSGSSRSMAARSAYLRSLAEDWRTPSWQKPFLREGRVPPGYEVDHITPLSVGGSDTPANMRLQGTDLHEMWHKRYRPWDW